MASNDSEPTNRKPTDASATAPATAPVIGITTYLEQAQTGVWDVRASFLPKAYIDAVTDAGGIAVLLPPQPADAGVARTVLGTLDGLIVSGGADVDPARYGQKRHERTGAPRTDRDEWEDRLLTTAIELELPFLGICRGAQMLNVALGGTLVQHLPDVVGSEAYQPGPAQFGETSATVLPDSRLAAVLGDAAAPLPIHVYHHQALDEVADGLRVTARTDDGVIEAVELETVPFGIGVQWHPEENAADRRLFAGLVDAARVHHATRSAITSPERSAQ